LSRVACVWGYGPPSSGQRREAHLRIVSTGLRKLAAALAALGLAACASHPTLDERTALLAPTLEYYAPANTGRAPLVILVSGCGGLHGLQGPKTVMKHYAGAATRAGAYAVVLDSFASRGIGFNDAVRSVCSGMRLHGNERAGDIIAAEALARRHWNVDFSGVILAGWSHGGWTVMELLSAGPRATNVGGFRIDQASPAVTPDAVALYYPYCGFLNSAGRSKWDFRGPLLYLNASANAPAEGKACADAIRKARGGMNGVEQVDYPNTHAFDEEDQVPGSEFKYDAEAAQRSFALFERFVREQAARLK
jgi:dienelactone hydrolase